jgi:hypothetical protein
MPKVADSAMAEQVYQEIKTVARVTANEFSDRRIRWVTFRDNKKTLRATVGDTDPYEGKIVLAIFESTDGTYFVCTGPRGARRGGVPFMVKREDISDFEEFEV